MAQGKPATDISCGDKCADVCSKVKVGCKVVCAVACGSLKMKTVKCGTSDVKTFTKLTNCIGDYYKPFFVNFANKRFLCTESEALTYKESLAIYESVGNYLRAADGFNVQIGESVGCCMRNLPEFILCFMAATSVGCRGVPLNSMNTSAELEYVMTDGALKVAFCDEDRMKLIAPFADKIGCKMVLCECTDSAIAEKVGARLWRSVVADGSSKPQADTQACKSDGTSDVMIMYTSGSTGKPKGVAHSHRSFGTALAMQEIANLASDDMGGAVTPKTILAVPLFHITGLTVALAGFIGGQELHILRKWDVGKALDIIEKEKITRFVGVPTMVRDLFEHPTFTVERMRSIKMIGGGGASMPPALMAKMAEVTGKSSGFQGYGLTESCGGVIVNKGLDSLKFPASTGKPIPFLVQACVKDPATGKKIDKPDERGELCVLTAMNMSRYHNRQEDTDKVLDKEGWFHTGDIAKINSQGFVFILDRLKDIIIRGGENIDCTEVETMIYTNPQVRECSIFGLPDERLGEVVGVAVYGEVKPQQLVDFLKAAGLAKFKIPEVENIFIHEEELPKGATHKIDKKGMREKYSALVKERAKA